MNYSLEEILIREEKLKSLIGSKVLYNNEVFTLVNFARVETSIKETYPNLTTPEISYCIICDLQSGDEEKVKVLSDEILPINY